MQAGAPVDAFGIGTQMGVSADAPYIDSVYKLVEFDGRPVMKLSSAKVSPPGRKQVWRRAEGEHADVLALRDEHGPADALPLLEPVMREGRRLVPATTPVRHSSRRGLDSTQTSPTSRRRRVGSPTPST